MRNFTIRLEIVAVVPGKKLSATDTIRLKESVTIPKAKFIQTPALIDMDMVNVQEPEKPIDVTELLGGYKDLEDKSAKLRLFINNRIGHNLDMPIDPVKTPELWTAAHKMFKGTFNKISYNMYLTCLRYMEDLGRELGGALAS